jgi:streptogramin lyase
MRVFLAIFAVVALAACSGAGGFAPFGSDANDAAAHRAVKSKLVLHVRVPKPARAHRRAHYISPGTKAMTLAFTGPSNFSEVVNLTPADQRCSGAPLMCTIAIDLVAGSYTVAANMYDQAPVNGSIPAGAKVLSSASGVSVVVKTGVANHLALTLGGVPASIVVESIAPVDVGNGFFNKPFTVSGVDADGYMIVGTYSTPIVLTNSDGTGATQIATSGSDNPPAHTLLSSSDTATLSYNGQTIRPAQITARAGSVSGSSLFEVYLPIYVADTQNNAVKEIPVGCGVPSCTITIGGGFSTPRGVAVDSTGNVYVADLGNDAVKMIPPGCYSSSCVETIGGGFNGPWGIAVDALGNVFVADYSDSTVDKIPPGCTSVTCVVSLGGGFDSPTGIALDQSGTLYVADAFHYAIKTMTATCVSPSCVTTRISGFSALISSITFDGAGNAYIAEPIAQVVAEIPAGCNAVTCVTAIGGGFSQPYGVAADWQSDVFVIDEGANTTILVPPGCTAAGCTTPTNSGFNAPLGIALY